MPSAYWTTLPSANPRTVANHIPKELRRESRHLNHLRRANNPLNFKIDGQVMKGKKLLWVPSVKQNATRQRIAELHRKQAQYRKTLHGQLSNRLLPLGMVCLPGGESMKGWQKLWGRSYRC